MEITRLLQRVHEGDPDALRTLMPLVYSELKKLAASHLRRELHNQQLDTTVLVHEAFLRMARGNHPSYENRSHFYGIASRVMRQVLLDMARARVAERRSAGTKLHLANIPDFKAQHDGSLLAMNEALDRLEESDPVKAQLIEMRYFGGMTAEESAAALAMPVHVVRRELRLAQAWLRKQMTC